MPNLDALVEAALDEIALFDKRYGRKTIHRRAALRKLVNGAIEHCAAYHDEQAKRLAEWENGAGEREFYFEIAKHKEHAAALRGLQGERKNA